MRYTYIFIFFLLIFESNAQKNILFIAVDDLKPMINSYGYDDMITPSIDAIASKGTIFKNASNQQSVCAPSRASLLTGLYPDQTRVWDLNTLIRDENPDVITLPQYFKNNGYYSVGLGKIFDNRSVDSNYDGISWSTQFLQGMPNNYYHDNDMGRSGYQDPAVHSAINQYNQYISANNITTVDGKREARKLYPLSKPATEGSQDLPDNAYVDGARTEYAMLKMDEAANSGKPFFLAVGYSKPHLPFVAPKSYWDLYDREDIEIHPEQGRDSSIPNIAYHNNHELVNSYSDIPFDSNLSPDKQKELIHGYKACVSYIDAQIGKLLSKLDQLGLSENTIIVLWGDHGWHLGDHALWIKHTNFEQAVRSPLIIYSPNIDKPNNISNSPVELLDIFPTLCELTGLEIPSYIEGKSLKPIMENPDHKVRFAALSQYIRTSNSRPHMGYTLRNERYRYTKWIQMDYRSGERYGPTEVCELYDYEVDVHETVNRCLDPSYSDIKSQFELEFKKRNIAQNSPSSYFYITTCADSYTAPDDKVYNENGIYTATLEANNGLDSVVTIELLFNNQLSNVVYELEGVLSAEQQESTYQWYNCENNQPILGQVSQTFQPEESGNYYVKINHSNCGEVTSDCISFTYNEILNLEPGYLKDYIIFPNPADKILNFKTYSNYNSINIQLVDVLGKVVLEKNLFRKTIFEIDVSKLSGKFIVNVILDKKESKSSVVIIQ